MIFIFPFRGVLVLHYNRFAEYLKKGGISTGRPRKCVRSDIGMVSVHVEFQFLGLLGELLTGQWMKEFYQSTMDQIVHVEEIKVVKVLCSLKERKDVRWNC